MHSLCVFIALILTCSLQFVMSHAFSTPCTSCLAGKYSLHGDVCTGCESGKFSGVHGAAVSNVCQLCPLHTHSPLASNSSDACVCMAGMALGPDQQCEECSAGKFKNTTGNAPCSDCVNVQQHNGVATCVQIVSFRLFLTALSPDQHVVLQNSIARLFGLDPLLVEIRVAAAGTRRLLSEPFAIDVIVSVPNSDASGVSTPGIPSMANIYQGLAEDQFVSAVVLVDGGTNTVKLTDMFQTNMKLRTVLNSNVGSSWTAGDKVMIYANGQRGINNVVLTCVGAHDDAGASRWSPANCEPLLTSDNLYLFFLKGKHLNLFLPT